MVIFTRTYDLLTWLLPKSERFPKTQRFVVTKRLQDAALDFQEAIFLANAHTGRTREAHLRDAAGSDDLEALADAQATAQILGATLPPDAPAELRGTCGGNGGEAVFTLSVDAAGPVCLSTDGSAISRGAASSLTVAGPRASLSSIARRVGQPSALKRLSRWPGARFMGWE